MARSKKDSIPALHKLAGHSDVNSASSAEPQAHCSFTSPEPKPESGPELRINTRNHKRNQNQTR